MFDTARLFSQSSCFQLFFDQGMDVGVSGWVDIANGFNFVFVFFCKIFSSKNLLGCLFVTILNFFNHMRPSILECTVPGMALALQRACVDVAIGRQWPPLAFTPLRVGCETSVIFLVNERIENSRRC